MDNLVKYLIEGVAVAVVAKMVLGERILQQEVLTVGATAGLVLMILDMFSPVTGVGARLGTGMELGGRLM